MSTTRLVKGGRNRILSAITVAFLAGVIPAVAIPTLQLDIGGGTSVNGTTIANASTFDVFALMTPDSDSTLSGLYRISAALIPQTAQSTPPPVVGTFSFNGTTYNVAADMAWGRPPDALMADTIAIGDEIAPHGIYDTYFMEFNVVFDANQKCLTYNVQDNPGDPVVDANGGLYWQSFAVDVSGMLAGYGIHFDLYQVASGTSGGNGSRIRGDQVLVTDLVEFAPFSHDAESSTSVPDGASTVTLLGLALTGIAAITRRMNG